MLADGAHRARRRRRRTSEDVFELLKSLGG